MTTDTSLRSIFLRESGSNASGNKTHMGVTPAQWRKMQQPSGQGAFAMPVASADARPTNADGADATDKRRPARGRDGSGRGCGPGDRVVRVAVRIAAVERGAIAAEMATCVNKGLCRRGMTSAYRISSLGR